MMKITARPTWQWPNNHNRARTAGERAISIRASPPDLKRMILPRSLDLSISFDLKYRR
jgi:hypothetical protein